MTHIPVSLSFTSNHTHPQDQIAAQERHLHTDRGRAYVGAMAAVLDAMAPYVMKLIADMGKEEVNMLLGISGEIKKLKDNMESIKAFLADAERRRLTDQGVQLWVRKLKGAMYDATDILDRCHLEADKRRESKCGSMEPEKAPSCCWSLLFCLRNPVFAHRMGSRIKELNQRLEGIHKAARDFSFNLASFPDQRMPLPAGAGLSSYQTRAQIDESAIVGEQIERDTKELIQVLTTADDDDNNNHRIKVVSIVGTGGMGKTTLAQKIFNEATIQEHFKTKIWLSITKNFDDAELLRTAIKHAGGDNHGHGGEHQDKSTLTDTLIHTLTSSAGSRFLLVMDDVWSERAWNDVLGVPVRNASRKQLGSWVLVTTRSAHIPQQMQAPLHEHRVRPLHEDDAWSLLKKQLQPAQVVGIDEQLKDIGVEILKKCDGLPLAVKVVGGLLSTRYPSEHEWKAVLNKPAWSLDGLPKELDNRIYLSYEDLTPQLRQCFLYCSLIPKGHVINQIVVTNMWVSEGFIQSPAAESSSHDEYGLEEMATEYYKELIERNLIEPMPEYSATGYVCTMHDVVRSFAEYMAREESLLVVDKEHLVAAAGHRGGEMLNIRRLSVPQTVSVGEWAVLQRQESLRTLIIYSGINFKPGDSLDHFSSLRVLCILSATNSDRLFSSLSKLKHLRHLCLEKTDMSRLPDDIHKMKFLRYIYLVYCEKLRHLPISTVKLMHLKSIVITGSNISTVPKGIGGLINLRMFMGFPVDVNMDTTSNPWCSLQELAPLSHLRNLAIYGVEKVSASWMAEKAMISTKGHLSYLKLNYNSTVEHTAEPRGEAEQQRQQSVMEEVLENLQPPTCLENLIMQGGYVGRRLPNWMSSPASADFKSLRYLTLENLPCCTQLPDGLCWLPSLEGLSFEDVPSIKRVGHEFQGPSSLAAGASTATSAPFPKLKELQLDGLPKWEEWEWNDSEEQGGVKATIAMPCLEEVYIQNCKLSHLPSGLASIKRLALRVLKMYRLTNLIVLENFPSVVQLNVFDCPELKTISNLSKLQKIMIVRCPNLRLLEGVPALDSMVLEDGRMEELPEYLAMVNPRYLELACNKKLSESLSLGSSEWEKISHIRKHNITCSEYFSSCSEDCSS
ncbi:hypothetical protein BS78_K201300 [Paspalum vaginatum]|uniref:Uncharacterized protein n=1 Tax=Paspalum vaginatum TaxID=158149 RepID=A0A9W8CF96_9POAL|nr:hypothetical protein BS78_K201300 [Paspalum vaginatum]